MNVNQFINVLAFVTLLEMMVTIGLGVELREILGVAKNWRLVAGAMLANYILVPAIALGLLFLFQAKPLIAVGFLIIAVCPGAPYGPPFVVMARGSAGVAAGLMAILAGTSAILAPLILGLLMPLVAGNQPINIDAAKIVTTLALGQFLPLCAGLFIHRRFPLLAQRMQKPAKRISMLLNLALIGVILAVQYPMLADIRIRAYLGMLLLVVLSMIAGWVSGSSGAEGRKAIAFTTAVRNAGVCLVIATSGFAGTPAVTAVTAFALFQTLTVLLIALGWGRWSERKRVAAE